jgi:4-hydroxybenzoate polyprenyltransferase
VGARDDEKKYNAMKAFLKLIRFPNLLIIAFTQYMVRWFILNPKGSTITDFQFFLLSLSTVMIAAAGYVINDYFDVRIDKVNKPERMVIDKGVKRRVAIGAHTVINILAVLIAAYVAITVGNWKLVLIHLLAATGLWLYSTTFKRKFLIGNIVISGFTALVPFITGLYEYSGCPKLCLDSWNMKVILSLSFFAFITTLLREIIKDIEDIEGDKEFGCKTMPIVLGIEATKRIVMAWIVLTMICLGLIQYHFLKRSFYVEFYYFLLTLQVPFIFLLWKLNRAVTKTDFRLAGNTAKFIMVMGVCFLAVHTYF